MNYFFLELSEANPTTFCRGMFLDSKYFLKAINKFSALQFVLSTVISSNNNNLSYIIPKLSTYLTTQSNLFVEISVLS
jgi:hypothetical protein